MIKFITKYFEAIISFIVLLPVTISFMLNSITSDGKIYISLAKITDLWGYFPSNIDALWEVKPIGNRFIFYVLYKITSAFTSFGTYEFELLFKAICIGIVLLICYYFSKQINRKYVFLLTSLAFLTPMGFISISPDWWACLISILALSLFLSYNKINWCLAGILITFIFLIKGVTLFLIIPIICVLYLFKKDIIINRLIYGACGSILSLSIILLSGLFPHIISDMILSMQIAQVGSIGIGDLIVTFITKGLIMWAYIPAILVGIYSTCLLYIKCTTERKMKDLAFIIIMWLSAFSVIFIQGEFWHYHYASFIIPSIISIILLTDNIIKYSIIIMFIIFIAFSGHWGMNMVADNKFYDEQTIGAKIITTNITDIKNQDTILYLDLGDAAYFFPANSSCRYVQPLPFQRNSDTWDMTGTSQYYEEYYCIMNYTGKYIIDGSDNLINRNTTDSEIVRDKINTEYERIWENNWIIYRRIL